MALLGSKPNVRSGWQRQTLLKGRGSSSLDPKATFGMSTKFGSWSLLRVPDRRGMEEHGIRDRNLWQLQALIAKRIQAATSASGSTPTPLVPRGLSELRAPGVIMPDARYLLFEGGNIGER
jgi:hypothetical protein